MDKMRMESVDMTAQNIEKIGALFPNCITEMLDEERSTPENKVYKKAINFELLKQMLSGDVLEGDEAYEFTWVGKKAAIVEAFKPTKKTLRPCKDESVNWDNTENIYIEGDNLEVLKLLQESYLGKIKMIYIDPPYNTGNDFIYRDEFRLSRDEYNKENGLFDVDNNRLFKNTDSNGRFHSDWCSMIYSRLLLSRNLLSDDGAIFISIGDDEVYNLLVICNEIFGESNFISIVPRIAKRTSDKGTHFKPTKDYVIVFAKNKGFLNEFGIPKDRDEKDYPYIDEDGRRYKKSGASLFQPSLDSRPNQRYYIEAPDGSLIIPPGNVFPEEKRDASKVKPQSNVDKVWRWSVDTYLNKKDLLIFTKASAQNPLLDENGNQSKWNIYPKVYFDEDIESSLHPEDVIYDYPNSQAAKELKALDIPFDFAKPVELIKFLISLVDSENMIVLDFFSGSGTTAHSVMKLNADDGAKRKYIMVQLPEIIEQTSEAAKKGYSNICQIGMERIKRAAKQIADEKPIVVDSIDTGFRVFKLDESNMNDVYYSAGEYTQDLLSALESNVKPDRNDLDLLFGCLLEWGLPLSLPYSSEQIAGCTVHNYNDGDLIACFDENVPESVIKEIAKRQPLRAVFRDSSFANSPSKINVGEIFKLMAPDTRVKVI